MKRVLSYMLEERAPGTVDDTFRFAGSSGRIHDKDRMVEWKLREFDFPRRKLGDRVVPRDGGGNRSPTRIAVEQRDDNDAL